MTVRARAKSARKSGTDDARRRNCVSERPRIAFSRAWSAIKQRPKGRSDGLCAALDKFLRDTELPVLEGPGSVSHERALEWASNTTHSPSSGASTPRAVRPRATSRTSRRPRGRSRPARLGRRRRAGGGRRRRDDEGGAREGDRGTGRDARRPSAFAGGNCRRSRRFSKGQHGLLVL